MTSPAGTAATPDGLDVQQLLRGATEELAQAGVDAARGDAELLLAHAAGTDRGRLAVLDRVAPEVAGTFRSLVTRRAAREPLQHLTGVAHFRHVTLAVGPGVFVPRPETELLVDAVLTELAVRHASDPIAVPVVVDLCAGSGAIAVAVAGEAAGAVVHAVERDPAAYAWLVRNTAGTTVRTVCADAAAALPELAGRVDVVVTNPPYVPLGQQLAPEVADHDPPAALWAGADGLDAVRVVERAAARLLVPDGFFVCEHDDTHGEAAPELLAATGRWTAVAGHRDLAGRPRYVTARRAS